MGRKNFNAYIKKQKEEKKRKKTQEKKRKKEARKNKSTGSSLEDMIAYVNKDGIITSEPPEEKKDHLSGKDK